MGRIVQAPDTLHLLPITPPPVIAPELNHLELLSSFLANSPRPLLAVPSRLEGLFGQIETELLVNAVEINDVVSHVFLLLFPLIVLARAPKDTSQRAFTRNLLRKWKENKEALIVEAMGDLQGVTSHRGVKQHANQLLATKNTRRAKFLIGANRLGDATRALGSLGMHDWTEETLNVMKKLHPRASSTVTVPEGDSPPPYILTRDAIRASILSFPKGTACGRDGKSADQLKQLLHRLRLDAADKYLDALEQFVNLLAAARAPSVLAPFYSAAPVFRCLRRMAVFVR